MAEHSYFSFGKFEDEFNLDSVFDLFEKYGVDYQKFLKVPGNYVVLEKSFSACADQLTVDWIHDEKDSVHSEDNWEELKDSIKEKRRDFLYKYGIEDPDYNESEFFDDNDLEEILEDNGGNPSRGNYYATDAAGKNTTLKMMKRRSISYSVNKTRSYIVNYGHNLLTT